MREAPKTQFRFSEIDMAPTDAWSNLPALTSESAPDGEQGGNEEEISNPNGSGLNHVGSESAVVPGFGVGNHGDGAMVVGAWTLLLIWRVTRNPC